MSTHLNPDLVERMLYPFAVSTRLPGQASPTISHFSHIGAASLLAALLSDPEVETRLFVANLSGHILYSAALGVGWYEVGTFDPALSAEVRNVLIAQRAMVQ